MKKNILKASAVWFACAVAGTVGCGGSGGGCGGSVPATTTQLTCGQGTHQVGSTCVANTAQNTPGYNNSNNNSTNTQAPPATQSIRK
jgi:hypothetical protein